MTTLKRVKSGPRQRALRRLGAGSRRPSPGAQRPSRRPRRARAPRDPASARAAAAHAGCPRRGRGRDRRSARTPPVVAPARRRGRIAPAVAGSGWRLAFSSRTTRSRRLATPAGGKAAAVQDVVVERLGDQPHRRSRRGSSAASSPSRRRSASPRRSRPPPAGAEMRTVGQPLESRRRRSPCAGPLGGNGFAAKKVPLGLPPTTKRASVATRSSSGRRRRSSATASSRRGWKVSSASRIAMKSLLAAATPALRAEAPPPFSLRTSLDPRRTAPAPPRGRPWSRRRRRSPRRPAGSARARSRPRGRSSSATS